MNIFMIMAGAILLMALIMRGNISGNKRFIFWACVVMFIVYGLRDAYSVGNDSSTSYLIEFNRMAEISWEDIRAGADYNDNILWSYLVKSAYILLDGNYQAYITTLSLFVVCVFGRFVYRYSVSPVQSLIYYWGLWFYTFNFSALKQSLAMTFLLLAFDAVLERKLIKFLLLTIVAALFHFPALIFLPAYAMATLNLRKSFLFVLAFLFVAVFLWRDEILEYFVQFYYEDREFIGEDRFLTGKVTVMLLLVLLAYYLRPPEKSDRVYSLTLQFVAIATVIQLFSVYSNVFERLADYYFQFSVIFVPFIFDRRAITSRETLQTTRGVAIVSAPYLLGAACLYRFYDYVTRPGAMLLPYQFFFQAK